MTGPFVRVQETKRYGPTWINVARIVKIQEASNRTTIFLEGAGSLQIDETAEALVGRLEVMLTGPAPVPQTTGSPPNGVRRKRARSSEEHHG